MTKKYMYVWCDWGLFDVKEVEVLEENYSWYKDSKNEYSLVRVRFSTTSKEFSTSMPCLKNHLFDTYDEAYSFGLKDCPAGAF